MYKKNRLLIVLTIIGMLCFNMNVNAASYDTIIDSSIGGGSSSGGIINDAYSKGAFINDNLLGIRVTLVDKSGKRIGETIDYYQQESGKNSVYISNSANPGFHQIGNSYKKEVLDGKSGTSNSYPNHFYINGDSLPGYESKWRIKKNVSSDEFGIDFTGITGYFEAIVEEFEDTIESVKNASIDDKIKVLSETNLGKLMENHGYEWKKEEIEQLCTSTSSGGVYLIYEPILNIIVGNKYAFIDEDIGDFSKTISQNKLKAYSKIKEAGISLANSCTVTKNEITCTGLNASGIDKFLNNFYDNKNFDYYKEFNSQTYISGYLKDLSNDIKNTGQTTYTAKFNENESLSTALSIINYVNVMKEQSDKALRHRKYFTGTITEIAKYLINIYKNEDDYIYYDFDPNGTVSTFLWMDKELKEGSDKFYFGVGSSRVTWNALVTSKAGNGINAVLIYNKSAFCNKCVVKEIGGEVSKVYFNSEEMTEKDNMCCYSTGYDNVETYNKVKGSFWYKATCMENTYCKVSDITEANKKCCTDLSSYSPADQETIYRNYGNNLSNYIKTMNESKYNICFPPTGCRYSIETQCPDCQLRNEGKIYDAVNDSIATDYDLSDEDLNCIFKNSSYSTGLGSKYCPVSCVENVKYDLPEDNKIYNSGRYITVGEGGTFSPIEISNEKVCRIAYVDYDQFEDELSKTNNDLYIAYQRYMIEKQQNITHDTPVYIYNKTAYGRFFPHCTSVRKPCWSCNCVTIKDVGVSCSTCCGTPYCSNNDYTQKTTVYVSYPSNSYGIVNEKFSITALDSEINRLILNKYSEIKQRIPARLETVKTLNRDLKGIVNAYNRCFSVKDRMETAPFEPEIYLNYDHGSYSLSNINLVKSETSGITSLNDATTLKTKWTLYEFKESGESLPTFRYDQYKFVGEAKNIIYSAAKEAKFKLPTEGMYVSVDKQTGISQMTNFPTTAYIGPHLPVKYNSKVTDNNITLNIATLGSSNKFESRFRSCDEYKCKFIINQDIIDTGTGIGLDVIYRPISLSNPFPDESGRGRQTGKNWCAEDDCSNNNSVVQSVILNNRGVSGERIYFDLDPLYTVTLTPANIRWIREYNKGKDYTDFSLRKETTADGEKWKSTFLEELNVTGCAYSNYTGRCREGDVY